MNATDLINYYMENQTLNLLPLPKNNGDKVNEICQILIKANIRPKICLINDEHYKLIVKEFYPFIECKLYHSD